MKLMVNTRYLFRGVAGHMRWKGGNDIHFLLEIDNTFFERLKTKENDNFRGKKKIII